MDTGGFAMYIETVLAQWWLKEETSWTGPDSFPALLNVCCWCVKIDNASVHKADEIKKLMEQFGIILMFLPPNMTQ
jgi:inhibitor of KinA sporulation pathway (predicted exonuclease)